MRLTHALGGVVAGASLALFTGAAPAPLTVGQPAPHVARARRPAGEPLLEGVRDVLRAIVTPDVSWPPLVGVLGDLAILGRGGLDAPRAARIGWGPLAGRIVAWGRDPAHVAYHARGPGIVTDVGLDLWPAATGVQGHLRFDIVLDPTREPGARLGLSSVSGASAGCCPWRIAPERLGGVLLLRLTGAGGRTGHGEISVDGSGRAALERDTAEASLTVHLRSRWGIHALEARACLDAAGAGDIDIAVDDLDRRPAVRVRAHVSSGEIDRLLVTDLRQDAPAPMSWTAASVDLDRGRLPR